MFRYLVITLRTPAFAPTAVPGHYAFLDRLREDGVLVLAGPFTDHSGGAYLLEVEDLGEATAIAHRDPLHMTGSSQITVREWNAK